MADFKAITEAALEDNPQRLEKLGFNLTNKPVRMPASDKSFAPKQSNANNSPDVHLRGRIYLRL